MFPERLETETLVLDPLRDADVFDLYDLFAEGRAGAADVFEYVPQEPYTSVKDARDQLAEADTAWDDVESAQYAVYTTDGALAGYTGLFPEWDRKAARIGFTLGKPYWGHGYAWECATVLLELAFDRLDLDVVAIDHADGNDRSKRAIEKIIDTMGGQYDGILRNWLSLGDEIADHHRYTVTREQYEPPTREQ